ncbi:hypothetical protein M9H77_35672 [Catharanthus roseus]|uniref:Uncharacterized protein n=1 Tax=Catharanthus roseus TaxID=4058 RepID=A0ACB9ZTX1_CATRO|nr:hypothetical protein M9H77_35672 [Catharanthus roseus]
MHNCQVGKTIPLQQKVIKGILEFTGGILRCLVQKKSISRLITHRNPESFKIYYMQDIIQITNKNSSFFLNEGNLYLCNFNNTNLLKRCPRFSLSTPYDKFLTNSLASYRSGVLRGGGVNRGAPREKQREWRLQRSLHDFVLRGGGTRRETYAAVPFSSAELRRLNWVNDHAPPLQEFNRLLTDISVGNRSLKASYRAIGSVSIFWPKLAVME